MKRAGLIAAFTAMLAACGGGGAGSNQPPTSDTTYNLAAAMSSLVASGLTTSVDISVQGVFNGTAQSVTGSGTYSLSPEVSAQFNGMSAEAQMQSIDGTLTVEGVSQSYSVSDTSYYVSTPSGLALLGQMSSTEYDVAETPINYPLSVAVGSSGVLGTVLRYADSTESVPLGTVEISYSVAAPLGPSSPTQVTITTAIDNNQGVVMETDTLVFNFTSSDQITLASASQQSATESVTITAD